MYIRPKKGKLNEVLHDINHHGLHQLSTITDDRELFQTVRLHIMMDWYVGYHKSKYGYNLAYIPTSFTLDETDMKQSIECYLDELYGVNGTDDFVRETFIDFIPAFIDILYSSKLQNLVV